VADEVVTLLGKPHPGERRLEGHAMRVSELLRRLENLSGSYAAHLVPGLAAPIDLQLFNAYRSYLFPQAYPVSLELHSDPRGTLFEAVKSVGGGQTFLSTTRPGITRGNHYHRAKVERFLVVQGTATIRVRRLFDESASVFTVSGDTPQYVDMPALHTHNITNTGTDDVMTLFWANEVFDPACPDTYAEMV
jgi:UDP-2-acetamido-2,6-beta-L-arabino-hexul-4-ose reductase